MRDCRIHIVESPSPDDFYEGTREGPTLASALGHAAIPSIVHTAVDLAHFKKALRAALAEHAEGTPVKYPVLHLSMHGTADGVVLTDGTRVPWTGLKHALVHTNTRLGGDLLVSMSACFGVNAQEMARGEGEPPFFALVGPSREVNWEDTVPAFVAFYTHVMRHDGGIAPGVTLMNSVVRNEDLFQAKEGEVVQREWRSAAPVPAGEIQREVLFEIQG